VEAAEGLWITLQEQLRARRDEAEARVSPAPVGISVVPQRAQAEGALV
jgi:hypothetical protein